MLIESLEDALKKDWPTEDDLTQGHVFLDENLIERIENLIQNHRICLLRGAEGRGKTVIARVLGFNKDRQGWKVYVIDVSAMEKGEIQRELNNITGLGGKKTLFIIENAHTSLDEITPEFVRAANDLEQEASFIFTSRKIFPGEEHLFMENPFEEWVEKGLYVDLNPDLQTIKGIIEDFMKKRKFTHPPNSLSEGDINWIEKEIGKTNLRRLSWYLKTWSKVGGSLSGVIKEEVLKEVLDDIIVPLDVNFQEMLLKVSAVFQFDVNFYGENYDKTILHELVKKGIITPLSGYYYRLQHSSDAAYIVEAEAVIRGRKTPAEITTNILKEYLQNKPENYYQLLRTLYRNKEKTILTNIFKAQETYDAIFEMVKDAPIPGVSSTLNYITQSCGKEKGLEFWSQYKNSLEKDLKEQEIKLKEKLIETNLTAINFLLFYIKKLDIAQRDRIVTLLLEADILEKKVNDSTFSAISNLISKTLPKESSLAFIQKLDPSKLAEKAKAATLQGIMWFLKGCSKDPSNKDFVKAFLLAISEKNLLENLLEKMKNSSVGVVQGCMRYIKKFDSHLYKTLKNALSPSHRLKIWLSSGLNEITHDLGKYRYSIGDKRQFAQSIVISLSSRDLTESIKKLYHLPETSPLEVLGRLLDFTYQIAFESNPEAVKLLAQQIVQKIDLTHPEKYNLEQLSLLVHNVEKCDETLCKELCSKILSDINLSAYVGVPFDKRLTILLWQLHKYNPANSKFQQLVKNIFALDFKELLNNLETEAVSLLIWNMLQIDYLKVQEWIKIVELKEWIQKATLSSAHDSFWFLWSLYHTNKDLSKDVAQLLFRDILPSLNEAKADELPLLGFFRFCGIQFNPNLTIPPTYEIAHKLSESIGLSELAFSLLFLQKHTNGEKLIGKFSQELARCAVLKHHRFPVQEMLSKHPFDATRQALQDILKNFSIPTGSDYTSIFSEMVRLTQNCLKKKGWEEITFSYLRNYFLSNPLNNPLFRNVDDSQRWINIAMEHGIYSYRETLYSKDPDSVVTWLFLNKDTPLVSSILMSNEINQQ